MREESLDSPIRSLMRKERFCSAVIVQTPSIAMGEEKKILLETLNTLSHPFQIAYFSCQLYVDG